MNFKTNKSMLICVFILTFIYAFLILINKSMIADIASIVCVLLTSTITLFNIKYISNSRKYLYFLIFLFHISYIVSYILRILEYYFYNNSIYLLHLKEICYVVESFLVAGIVMSIIFLSMKFMDKRQFAIDFFAVSFALYYIARPILSSIFSHFDIFFSNSNDIFLLILSNSSFFNLSLCDKFKNK